MKFWIGLAFLLDGFVLCSPYVVAQGQGKGKGQQQAAPQAQGAVNGLNGPALAQQKAAQAAQGALQKAAQRPHGLDNARLHAPAQAQKGLDNAQLNKGKPHGPQR